VVQCAVAAVCPCSELKNAINGRMLTELGELEQNLVYGDMGSAELIKFLQGEYTCPGGSRKGQRRGIKVGPGWQRTLAGSVPDGLGSGPCRIHQVPAR
jgi:hypothetical protein